MSLVATDTKNNKDAFIKNKQVYFETCELGKQQKNNDKLSNHWLCFIKFWFLSKEVKLENIVCSIIKNFKTQALINLKSSFLVYRDSNQ